MLFDDLGGKILVIKRSGFSAYKVFLSDNSMFLTLDRFPVRSRSGSLSDADARETTLILRRSRVTKLLLGHHETLPRRSRSLRSISGCFWWRLRSENVVELFVFRALSLSHEGLSIPGTVLNDPATKAERDASITR